MHHSIHIMCIKFQFQKSVCKLHGCNLRMHILIITFLKYKVWSFRESYKNLRLFKTFASGFGIPCTGSGIRLRGWWHMKVTAMSLLANDTAVWKSRHVFPLQRSKSMGVSHNNKSSESEIINSDNNQYCIKTYNNNLNTSSPLLTMYK